MGKTVMEAAPKIPMTEKPCPRCHDLVRRRVLRVEMVMPLPQGAFAPRASDKTNQKCCFDCASADALIRRQSGMDFEMARIAVGSCRQEILRLPQNFRPHWGLVKIIGMGMLDLELEAHHSWLEEHVHEWNLPELFPR